MTDDEGITCEVQSPIGHAALILSGKKDITKCSGIRIRKNIRRAVYSCRGNVSSNLKLDNAAAVLAFSSKSSEVESEVVKIDAWILSHGLLLEGDCTLSIHETIIKLKYESLAVADACHRDQNGRKNE